VWSAVRADDFFLELKPSMVSLRLPCVQMKATSVAVWGGWMESFSCCIYLHSDIRNSLSQMSDEPQLFFVFKAANWGGSWGGKAIFRVAFATLDPPLVGKHCSRLQS